MKTLLEATFNVLKLLFSEMLNVMCVGVTLFSGWWLFDKYPLASILVALFVIIALFILFEAGKIEEKKQREIERRLLLSSRTRLIVIRKQNEQSEELK